MSIRRITREQVLEYEVTTRWWTGYADFDGGYISRLVARYVARVAMRKFSRYEEFKDTELELEEEAALRNRL